MSDKFVLIPVDLLKNIKNLIKGSQYEEEVTKILESREVIENQDVTKLPKEGHVKCVIDGDTVELQNGLVPPLCRHDRSRNWRKLLQRIN